MTQSLDSVLNCTQHEGQNALGGYQEALLNRVVSGSAVGLKVHITRVPGDVVLPQSHRDLPVSAS